MVTQPFSRSGFALLLATLAVVLLVGCDLATDTKTIKDSDYGDEWPLTVAEAKLICKPPGAVFVRVGDKYYGVNGTSHAGWIADRYLGGAKVHELEEVWRKNPDHPDLRVGVFPLINDGLELCDE